MLWTWRPLIKGCVVGLLYARAWPRGRELCLVAESAAAVDASDAGVVPRAVEPHAAAGIRAPGEGICGGRGYFGASVDAVDEETILPQIESP